ELAAIGDIDRRPVQADRVLGARDIDTVAPVVQRPLRRPRIARADQSVTAFGSSRNSLARTKAARQVNKNVNLITLQGVGVVRRAEVDAGLVVDAPIGESGHTIPILQLITPLGVV